MLNFEKISFKKVSVSLSDELGFFTTETVTFSHKEMFEALENLQNLSECFDNSKESIGFLNMLKNAKRELKQKIKETFTIKSVSVLPNCARFLEYSQKNPYADFIYGVDFDNYILYEERIPLGD